MITTQETAIVALVHPKRGLIGVIHKDPEKRVNVFYSIREMSMEQIQSLFKVEDNILSK